MTEDEFFRLIGSLLTVIVTIGLIIGLKVFGNLPIDNIGPELNILTYGFLWDTILQATYGNYWKNYPTYLEKYKGLTLCAIVICNILLMAINLKLSEKLKKRRFNHRKHVLKFWSYFLGILGLMIFLTLKVYFE